jgi:protein-tyrosine phosphatase
MALLSLPALIFVLLFVCSFAYLSWQANIDIPEKDTLFKVQTNDSFMATRNSDAEIIIVWNKTINPAAIAVSTDKQHSLSHHFNIPAGSTSLALFDVPPLPRPFFTISQTNQAPITVAERILPFEGINNFRDLGGYRTTDGRSLKWGKLFRSGHLGTPSHFDHNLLQDLGINTIIDLRSPAERRKMPDTEFNGVTNLHIPLFRSDPFMYRHIMFQRHKLGQRLEDVYTTWVIDGSAKELGHILQIISKPVNLPLLFHCTAGKDRTGITAALLLLALGVSETTAIADYTLSNAAADRFMADYQQPLSLVRFLGIKQEHFYPIIATPPQMMVFTINHIKRKYGSVLNYLTTTTGVSQETLQQLQNNLLDE